MTLSTVQVVDAEIVESDLTPDEAHRIVESIKSDLGSLRSRVYALWSRKGWKAMGYDTWESFMDGEFPELNRSTLHRYVAAAQVERLVLAKKSPMGDEVSERVLRPLVPFRDDPATLRTLWAEAGKRAKAQGKDRPTTSIVEAVVADYKRKQDEVQWPKDQMRRRLIVEAGGTVVANQHSNSADAILIRWATDNDCLVQIGRTSPWGNPFVLGEDGDRDTVCDSFEIFFGLKFSLHDRVLGLKGKVLACWCYPERCHGDHLIAILNQGGHNADF